MSSIFIVLCVLCIYYWGNRCLPTWPLFSDDVNEFCAVNYFCLCLLMFIACISVILFDSGAISSSSLLTFDSQINVLEDVFCILFGVGFFKLMRFSLQVKYLDIFHHIFFTLCVGILIALAYFPLFITILALQQVTACSYGMIAYLRQKKLVIENAIYQADTVIFFVIRIILVPWLSGLYLMTVDFSSIHLGEVILIAIIMINNLLNGYWFCFHIQRWRVYLASQQ